MLGPGSRKMGGAGIKAGKPPTAMAGSGLGAPKGGAAMAMGAPPMAPKVANVRPPGIGAGAPPPMPGGAPMGAKPAGPPPNPMSGGGGGMGGSGGFAKGGSAAPQRPQTVQLNRSQMPDKGIMFEKRKSTGLRTIFKPTRCWPACITGRCPRPKFSYACL